jgi:hypothetical protein
MSYMLQLVRLVQAEVPLGDAHVNAFLRNVSLEIRPWRRLTRQ